MPDNKIECRSCGFVIFDKDPLEAAKGFCVNCGQIVGWNPPSVPPKVLCGGGNCIGVIGQDGRCKECGLTAGEAPPLSPALLTSCHGCGHNLSKRASTCPKCSAIRVAECHICKKMIPANSDSCPECGDPKPFGELADALTTPKNLIIDSSPTAKKQSNNNKDKPGKDSENLGTRWLTFWNYFSLPVGGLLGLFAGVGLLKLSYLWGFVIISVSILQLMTAFEMRKRTFWAWQMNWVIIVFMLVGSAVLPTKPNSFDDLFALQVTPPVSNVSGDTSDPFAPFINITPAPSDYGSEMERIYAEADAAPKEWELRPYDRMKDNFASFVFRLILGGLIFLWPSYVYWNKRKSMFVDGE